VRGENGIRRSTSGSGHSAMVKGSCEKQVKKTSREDATEKKTGDLVVQSESEVTFMHW